MNASNRNFASRFVWVIYFVGFDDTGTDAESYIEPFVARERIETTEDVETMHADANLAALLRGGRVVAVVADNDADAERTREAIETEILRYR